MLKVTKKYILAFPESNEKQVLDLVSNAQGLEVVSDQLKEATAEKEATSKQLQETDYLISSLDFAIGYLNPFAEKVSLREKLKYPRIIIKKDLVSKLTEKTKLKSSLQRVAEIEKEIENITRLDKEQQEILASLDNLGDLNFLPQDTEHTFSLIVSLSESKSEELTAFVLKHEIHERKLKKEQASITSLIIGLKESDLKERFLEFLKTVQAEVLEMNFSQSPVLERKQAMENIEENQKKKIALDKELKKIAGSIKEFKVYHDLLIIKRSKLEIKKRSLGQSFLNYLVFWTTQGEKEKLGKKLRKLSSEISIIETSLKEGESAPVILENKKNIQPFEYVTEIFGLPRSDEIDPTPYHAFFFILFFGICITDAGYGLLLALFAGLALVFLKDMFNDNKLIKLLFYGGISTFIVGALFGSYFGATPEALKLSFLSKLKVIDPIEDTLLFMGIAFGLGYIQIIFAQIVKIISGLRNKNKPIIMSGLAWGLLYLFGAVLLLSIKLPYLKYPGLIGVFAVLASLFFVESMGQKIFLRPLIGAVNILQGLINTTSDILSYSRLMALGLATAVIALIVNQIAGLFGGMIPYVGWLVGGLILIGGHIFNLAINALSSFIHSGRLQFVEFFPKFLEGGGRRLQPIKRELKYIKVEE